MFRSILFVKLCYALSLRFNDDNGMDNNSANSRVALLDMLEESKCGVKRKYSNASQSSHEFSDGERNKETRLDKAGNMEDPPNSGSVVGIDWLFGCSENGDCPLDLRTSKNSNRFQLQKPVLLY